ncbi:MAG: peptidase M28 [Acidobacteria bacterium]|nr:MAG: peptidase M28 [Acidobacteriota bacterium]
MIRRQFAAVLLLFVLVAPYAAFGQQPQPNPTDPIERIKDEGMNRSQVMQTLSYLSDVIGPRLTASPAAKRANEWTRDTLAKWGLQNAHLEAWGPFGRGWTLKHFSAQVVEPQDIPLIAYPKAWSPGVKVTPEVANTSSPKSKKNMSLSPPAQPPGSVVTSDVIYLDAKNEADLDKYKGQLKGKIVLISQPVEVKAVFDPLGTRRDEKNLLALANANPPGPGGGFGGGGGGGRGGAGLTQQERQQQLFQQTVFTAKRMNMLVDEGAAVAVDVSPRGTGGTIFVQQATVAQPIPKSAEEMRTLARLNYYDPKAEAKMIPQVTVAVEHYNRMIRMIQQGEKLKMTVDLQVEYQDQDNMGYNTVAEIPGSDLKDEIVMLGGHMDSWQAGTGATDNGAGVAVALEAVRILQTVGLKPRRTIRVALWTGEEEGLLGSHAYVAQHFGKLEGGAGQFGGGGGFGGGDGGGNRTPSKLTTLPEYEKFSGYFNLDNGTGKIRGVYLQGNNAVRDLFKQWLLPFGDLGASTITISNTGGTDHQSFDGIGLPGFQFIQDEIEYGTRTHHSNQDVFDRVQADDMKQAATIMAAFVYNTAMRDDKLPRKPAPGR